MELKTAITNLVTVLGDVLEENDYDGYERLLNAGLLDKATELLDLATELEEAL